jgi:hypothetical protein
VRLPPGHVHAQRDRAAVGVPDDASGRLGSDHRDRIGIDQDSLAQMPRAGDASRLLVADEVEHDAGIAQQPELARSRRAVEHAHEAALHVGRAAPDDPAVTALRLELRRILRRHDVEVAVEVDDPRSLPDAAAHDARLLELAARRQLDQLRAQIQPLHRVLEHSPAATQPAARRVAGIDGHQLLEQHGHLIGAGVEPVLHVTGHSWMFAHRRHASESTMLPMLLICRHERRHHSSRRAGSGARGARRSRRPGR